VTKSCKQECNCTLNEEFIVLLQKEIKRLQNITNDLSYQLIMNGHTPVIKESERMPIDLSINPLRRREQKSKISDQKMIPSKLVGRVATADCFESCNGYPVQPESARPGSSFRIRNQNSSANTNCTGDMEAENSKTNIHKYFDKVADCQADCLASPNGKGDQEVWNESTEKGPSKAEKYNKEKKFVKKIEEDNKQAISSKAVNFNSNLKKEGLSFKKGKATSKTVVLPPLEQKEDSK